MGTTPSTPAKSGGGKVVGVGLVLGAVIAYGIYASVTGDGETRSNAPAEQAASGDNREQPAPQIEHQATATEYITVTGEWHEMPNRPHWTHCVGDMTGIERQYRVRPGGDWVSERPPGNVYGWRYRSIDGTERTFDRNWDTNDDCSTTPPS